MIHEVNTYNRRSQQNDNIEVIMKCANCGKEFGNGITCVNCGTDRFTGLGNYHGYSPSRNSNNVSAESESENNIHFCNTAETIVCYKCNEIIPSDSNFCPFCGIKLNINCPECGHIFSSKFMFCNHCGKRVEKRYICKTCGYIYEGFHVPDKCPICKAPSSNFEELFL